MIVGKIENGLERRFVKHQLNCLLITNPKCYRPVICTSSVADILLKDMVKRLSWLFESWILLWSRPRKIDARSFEVTTFMANRCGLKIIIPLLKVITNKPRGAVKIKLTNPIQSSFIVDHEKFLNDEAIIEPWSGAWFRRLKLWTSYFHTDQLFTVRRDIYNFHWQYSIRD